jgi:hypothetical protein
MKLAALALPCLLLAAACGPRIAPLVARAQFDFSCPEAELRLTTIDKRTIGVTGCGKRATYLDICDTTGWGPMNCHWVMNSPESTYAPTGPGNVPSPPPPLLPPPAAPAPASR